MVRSHHVRGRTTRLLISQEILARPLHLRPLQSHALTTDLDEWIIVQRLYTAPHRNIGCVKGGGEVAYRKSAHPFNVIANAPFDRCSSWVLSARGGHDVADKFVQGMSTWTPLLCPP